MKYVLVLAILLLPFVFALNATNETDEINEAVVVEPNATVVPNETVVGNGTNVSVNISVNSSIVVNGTENSTTAEGSDEGSSAEESVVIPDSGSQVVGVLEPLRRTEFHAAARVSVSGVRVARESCEQDEYEVVEAVMGLCEHEREVCSGPNNASCVSEVFEYACKKNDRIVTHVVEECEPLAYSILDQYDLELAEYACSVSLEGAEVIVICDSKWDGNGDGVCHDGESCVKHVFGADGFASFEKNSGSVFVADDESFFLAEPVVEVRR